MRKFAALLTMGACAASLAAAPAALATFPGENGAIAFTRDGDIWTINPDGTGERRLTSGPAEDTMPAWSPDGRELMFTRQPRHGEAFEIHRMRADGSGRTFVRLGLGARFSNDGQRIAFDSVMVADRDGANATGPFADVDAITTDWSPINDLILYDAGINFIFVEAASPQGTSLSLNLPNDENDLLSYAGGSWSPDGTRIALAAVRDSESPCFGDPTCPPNPNVGIVLMDLDSKRRVIHPSGVSPAWSPDGTRIAFRSDSGQVQIIRTDGTGKKTLARGAQPDWQPLARKAPPRQTRTVTVTVPVVVEKVVTRLAQGEGARCVIPRGKPLTLRLRSRAGALDLGGAKTDAGRVLSVR